MDPFGAREPARPRAASKEEFARFYRREYPRLVALLHALRGDRGHAQRVAERAFARAWIFWPKVRTVPDPAAWTRGIARRTRAPHNTDPDWFESEWVAPRILPVFEALSRMSVKQRTVLVLHYVGGLTLEQIGEEERRAPETISMELASARASLAHQLGGRPPGRGYADVHEVWITDAMANLAHALSYTRDRRDPDRVFRSAAHQRAWIAGIAAGFVLIGVAGTTAIVSSVNSDRRAGVPDVIAPLTLSPSLPSGPKVGGYPPAAPAPGQWGGERNPASETVAPRPEVGPMAGQLPGPPGPVAAEPAVTARDGVAGSDRGREHGGSAERSRSGRGESEDSEPDGQRESAVAGDRDSAHRSAPPPSRSATSVRSAPGATPDRAPMSPTTAGDNTSPRRDRSGSGENRGDHSSRAGDSGRADRDGSGRDHGSPERGSGDRSDDRESHSHGPGGRSEGADRESRRQ